MISSGAARVGRPAAAGAFSTRGRESGTSHGSTIRSQARNTQTQTPADAAHNPPVEVGRSVFWGRCGEQHTWTPIPVSIVDRQGQTRIGVDMRAPIGSLLAGHLSDLALLHKTENSSFVREPQLRQRNWSENNNSTASSGVTD